MSPSGFCYRAPVETPDDVSDSAPGTDGSACEYEERPVETKASHMSMVHTGYHQKYQTYKLSRLLLVEHPQKQTTL